jgi:hypothetical protein
MLNIKGTNLRLDSDAPEAARQPRVKIFKT